MALQDQAGRITGLVLVNAVGVEVPDEPIRDFFALDPRSAAEFSFHDSSRFYRDPATIPAEQAAEQKANMTTMRSLAGDPYMHDPTLLSRLSKITIPVLVIWGESDRIATPAYGRAYANGFARARFEPVSAAGHLPQIERPAPTLMLIKQHAIAT